MLHVLRNYVYGVLAGSFAGETFFPSASRLENPLVAISLRPEVCVLNFGFWADVKTKKNQAFFTMIIQRGRDFFSCEKVLQDGRGREPAVAR